MDIWSHIISYFSLVFSKESLLELLSYDNEKPLIFTQFYFWGFFAVVLLIYSIVYKKKGLRNSYLFLISLFFYYKTSGLFVFILLFSTFSDYIIGGLIYRSSVKWKQQILVGLSVFINLSVLCYFKYAYFFTNAYNQFVEEKLHVFNHFAYWTNSLTGSHFEVDKILLPVGISFYTFQTISYSVDVYKKRVKPVKNILDFGFYVSFFPQLVAGPIVRASEFIPQLYKPFVLSKKQFGLALFWILNGLIKKVVIGDYIAVNFIDRVFDNPMLFSGLENLFALYGYSLQVYADFSGYTDIAIGVALLMGFYLPTNFNSPYKAKNVGEFWKRWHMSLSTWLKDYLYIPLGGNRAGSIATYLLFFMMVGIVVLLSGKMWVLLLCLWIILMLAFLAYFSKKFRNWLNTNINLLITMLLGGLWHGSSWQFVIWGGLNGLGLMVFKLWKKISPYGKSKHWLAKVWMIFITFNFITFTRIWFRAETMQSTKEIIQQISTHFQPQLFMDIITSYSNVFIFMLVGYFIHWLPVKTKQWYRITFIKLPLAVQAIITIIAVFGIYQAMSSDMVPFIYFQF